MTSPAWRGWLNPDETDQHPESILSSMEKAKMVQETGLQTRTTI